MFKYVLSAQIINFNNYNILEIKDVCTENSWETVEYSSEVYGLHIDINCKVFGDNKDVLDKENINMSETYDGIIKIKETWRDKSRCLMLLSSANQLITGI